MVLWTQLTDDPEVKGEPSLQLTDDPEVKGEPSLQKHHYMCSCATNQKLKGNPQKHRYMYSCVTNDQKLKWN